MSYKYDVAILMKKENYEELKDKINTQGIDDFEVNKFNNGKVSELKHYPNYYVIEWNYVGWDSDTNEMVEIVEEYLDMLHNNYIPFRYIKIGEFLKDVTDWKRSKDAESEAAINCIYPRTVVKVAYRD